MPVGLSQPWSDTLIHLPSHSAKHVLLSHHVRQFLTSMSKTPDSLVIRCSSTTFALNYPLHPSFTYSSSAILRPLSHACVPFSPFTRRVSRWPCSPSRGVRKVVALTLHHITGLLSAFSMATLWTCAIAFGVAGLLLTVTPTHLDAWFRGASCLFCHRM